MTTRNQIVLWRPESEPQTEYRVLNPEIPLANYTFLFNPETFSAVATTPSMSLTSLSLTGPFYTDELSALNSWYGDAAVMEKYASGAVRTLEKTEQRYKELADRWTYGFPYSGMMARNADGKIVGMFNLGYAVDDENKLKPGTTEFAAIISPEEWNNGLATEALILLLVVVKCLNEAGYEIADAPLQHVTTAAREDNEWANKALQNSAAMVFQYKKDVYGAPRNVYSASVKDIKALLENTERSQHEAGTYSELKAESAPAPTLSI